MIDKVDKVKIITSDEHIDEKLDFSDKYDRLLEVVRTQDDINQWLADKACSDGFYLYHLSEIRQNVIKWYSPEDNSSVMELGAECGPITSFMCREFKSVIAVEPSYKKALINASRNHSFDNLTIYNLPISEIELNAKVGMVTLIGENAATTCEELKKSIDVAWKHLSQDGVFLLANDNRYGLKYWSGMVKDGNENVFSNLVEDNGLYTYEGIKTMLEECGFRDIEVYIPIPDYKLPLEVYGENCIPNDVITSHTKDYSKKRCILFDETKVAKRMMTEDMFKYFANSYIVICKK